MPGKKRWTRHVTSGSTRGFDMGDSMRWAAMRWLRFESGGRSRVGYLRGADGQSVVQPVVAESLQDVIAGRRTGDAGAPVPRRDVRLLAPLRPGKILCIGLNYMDHCREQKMAPPDRPTLFAKFPSSVIAPSKPIRWPADFSDQVDYEAELARGDRAHDAACRRGGRAGARVRLHRRERRHHRDIARRATAGVDRAARPPIRSARSAPSSSPPTRSPTRSSCRSAAA